MAKPRRPPNVLAIKPLYGCCRSMTGPSVLTWYSEVSCRCLRHLYAPWWLFPTLFVRCRHRRSAVDVFSIPLTRRVCLRRLLWTKVLLSGIAPSGYPDTMQIGLSVLPRDSDVLCSEITLSVQQLLPDWRIMSGLIACTIRTLPGPPASCSPDVTAHQKRPPGCGTACVDRHKQP